MRAPQIGFPTLVQDFFLNRLIAQRGASARTVESYRDAFELLFAFTAQHTGKHPSDLRLADLDAPLVLDFLDHLETKRGNSIRTRNARLAAIHSFMRYAAIRDPASLPVTQRVLAIPPNVSTDPSWSTSPGNRSPRSWTHPTDAPGTVTVTPSCSPPSTTPAPASRRSPACGYETYCSTGAPRCYYMARAPRNV